MNKLATVTSGIELTDAIAFLAKSIAINGTASGLPSVRLPAGVNLKGGTLKFKTKGSRLTSDNDISNLRVVTSEHAIQSDARD
jgi:hypothetical protein